MTTRTEQWGTDRATVLASLCRRADGLRPDVISRLTSVDPSDVERYLSDLRADGLVRDLSGEYRTPGGVVAITPEGEAAVCQARQPEDRKLSDYLGVEMKPSKELDLDREIQARDESMAQVESSTDSGWLDFARDAVIFCAETMPSFTTDKVWERMNLVDSGLAASAEPRALGPIMLRLSRSKRIAPTGDFVQSARRHAAMIRVWRLS